MFPQLKNYPTYEVWEGDVLVYSDEMTQPKGPELPAECHNTQPVDSKRAWAAVVAMCAGQ
jgi:hypothetical protein